MLIFYADTSPSPPPRFQEILNVTVADEAKQWLRRHHVPTRDVIVACAVCVVVVLFLDVLWIGKRARRMVRQHDLSYT